MGRCGQAFPIYIEESLKLGYPKPKRPSDLLSPQAVAFAPRPCVDRSRAQPQKVGGLERGETGIKACFFAQHDDETLSNAMGSVMGFKPPESSFPLSG
jgi:hypothetical protein